MGKLASLSGLTACVLLMTSDSGCSESTAYRFEEPVRIKAGDDYVSVESPGYACPTLADVDGDGREDLVVGQFRDGNLQFFRNIAGQGQQPQFAAGEWLMTGEERAIVPGVW